MRGVSILELLIAIAILSGTILAVLLTATELPRAVRNGALEIAALQENILPLLPQLLSSAISSTSGKILLTTTWHDGRNRMHTRVDTSLSASSTSLCEGYVRGDWANPSIHTYSFAPGDLLPNSYAKDTYTISSITVTNNYLAIGIGSTTYATSSTLAVFTLPTRQNPKPVLIQALDNATSTKLGLRAMVADGEYLYAATNQNAPYLSCKQGTACAQLEIFKVASGTPSYWGLLKLSVSTAPFAIGANGQSAGRAITYANGYVYLGLTKGGSTNTMEFNVIDVRDQKNPVWVGGFHVGHGVTSIVIQGTTAYIATDDTSREFMSLDIHNPTHITQLSSYDTPGNPIYGYGNALAGTAPTTTYASSSQLVLGRTYTPNASELQILSSSGSTTVAIGTALPGSSTGESIQALLLKDFLAVVLTNSKLYLLDIYNPSATTAFAPPLSIGTNASALACYGSMLFIGGTDTAQKNATLTVITP